MIHLRVEPNEIHPTVKMALAVLGEIIRNNTDWRGIQITIPNPEAGWENMTVDVRVQASVFPE